MRDWWSQETSDGDSGVALGMITVSTEVRASDAKPKPKRSDGESISGERCAICCGIVSGSNNPSEKEKCLTAFGSWRRAARSLWASEVSCDELFEP